MNNPPETIPHRPLQRYHNMTELVLIHKLWLPRPHATWRLLARPVVGSINGLDRTFAGLAVATNGIIVAIETSAGKILFAHLQWFQKDDISQESDLDRAMDNVAAVSQARLKAMVQMIDTFTECL